MYKHNNIYYTILYYCRDVRITEFIALAYNKKYIYMPIIYILYTAGTYTYDIPYRGVIEISHGIVLRSNV